MATPHTPGCWPPLTGLARSYHSGTSRCTTILSTLSPRLLHQVHFYWRRTRARRNIRATNPLRRRRRKSTTHLRYHHDYSIRCTTATRSRTSRSGHSEIPTKDSRLYYVKPPSAGRSRAHQPITVFYYFSTASLLGFFIGPTSQLQIHISCVFLGHHPAWRLQLCSFFRSVLSSSASFRFSIFLLYRSRVQQLSHRARSSHQDIRSQRKVLHSFITSHSRVYCIAFTHRSFRSFRLKLRRTTRHGKLFTHRSSRAIITIQLRLDIRTFSV